MSRRWMMAALLAAGLAQSAAAFAGAKITLVNEDAGTGQGLDDRTPAAPVGGNPGTTRGQQAIIVFNFAADLWGSVLDSDAEIFNSASFAPLYCDTNSGVLGGSGTTHLIGFNAGPELPAGAIADTWYHAALGDALAGRDLDTEVGIPADTPDIGTQFNGKLGSPGCLDSLKWYFGLDGNTPDGAINFLDVVMHEMAHGLGFSEFNKLETGAQYDGLQDIYSTFMKNNATGKMWTAMTDAERAAAATSDGRLVFTGATVKTEAATGLTAGKDADGNVRLYAPPQLDGGSSVSHYDKVTSPNTLMEPAINQDLLGALMVDLTPALFKDEGWTVIRSNQFLLDCDTGVPSSTAGGAIVGANLYGSARAFAGGAANLNVYRDAIRGHVESLAADGILTETQHASVLACLTDEATEAQFKEWGNGITGPGDAIPLANKVPVSNLMDAAGSQALYSFTASAGSVLSIMTYGGTGDVSLYVSFEAEPTASSYDAKSTRVGNNETVRFNAPRTGTYYIRLVGVSAYSGVTLVARQ